MPFQSEAQRKYLWANEPEIARDWTDEYGSRIQKDDGGMVELIEMIAREPAAFGGLMGDDGRRAFGLGGIFKKAKRAVKKIIKSPLGKAALAAGLMYLTKGKAAKEAGSWRKYLLGAPSKGIGALTGAGPATWASTTASTPGLLGAGGPMGKFALTAGKGSFMPTWLGAGAVATGAPFLMGDKQDVLPDMPGGEDQAFDFNFANMRKDIARAVESGDYNEFTDVLNQYDLTEGANIPYWDTLAHAAEGGRIGYASGTASPHPNRVVPEGDFKTNLLDYFRNKFAGRKTASPASGLMIQQDRPFRSGDPLGSVYPGEGGLTNVFANKFAGRKTASPDPNVSSQLRRFAMYQANGGDLDFNEWMSRQQAAQGGRIGRQEGGLMNLGGMEKDYREDGGFVPIGGEEKADDVPARLSRNEFVFTADAVRNAGGGDIDKGAEVMENVMKNLEAGGKVSEESQGQGARDMFEVSERLSEVV